MEKERLRSAYLEELSKQLQEIVKKDFSSELAVSLEKVFLDEDLKLKAIYTSNPAFLERLEAGINLGFHLDWKPKVIDVSKGKIVFQLIPKNIEAVDFLYSVASKNLNDVSAFRVFLLNRLPSDPKTFELILSWVPAHWRMV